MGNIKSRLQFFLIIMIILSAWFLTVNLFKDNFKESAVGKAFYMTKEGSMDMSEPGKELPNEISSINIVFWSAFLAIFVVLLFTMKFWLKEEVKKEEKGS